LLGLGGWSDGVEIVEVDVAGHGYVVGREWEVRIDWCGDAAA